MSLGSYLLGSAELILIVAAIGFGAHRLRARMAPTWRGTPALLAEVVLGLSLVIVVLEALGTVGALQTAPLVLCCLAAGAAAGLAAGRRPSGGARAQSETFPDRPESGFAIAVAVAIAAVVLAHWSLGVQASLDKGMLGFDTMWYHMPFAARFVQEGSVTGLHFTEPVSLHWFSPANSEILHSGGILLFDRDILSPLLNLAWLALALLAAWCVGRPYGVGALAVLGAAVVLDAGFLNTQPGGAKNDVCSISLFLSSIALIVNGGTRAFERTEARGPVVLAGLAAGLAAGTRLTMLAPVAALSIGVVAIAARGRRLAVAGLWAIAVLATGGFWYLRNLVSVGNPLPWIKGIGVGALTLPAPDWDPDAYRPPFSVAHYLTDGDVWRDFFVPALADRLGPYWWAILALAAAGMAISILAARTRIQRMLGIVAIASALAYLVTPNTAPGLEGRPRLFDTNLRYGAAALILGLVLLPTATARFRSGWSRWALGAMLMILLLSAGQVGDLRHAPHPAAVLLFAVALVLAPAALIVLWQRGTRRLVVGGVVVLVALCIGLAWPEERDYLRNRYADAPLLSRLHLDSAIGWANGVSGQRIALSGTVGAFFQYGLYGRDVDNTVQYVGRRGPHGAFSSIHSCAAWRRALNAGRYGYVVTTPFIDPLRRFRPRSSPAARWTRDHQASEQLVSDGGVAVFRIEGRLDPRTCPSRAGGRPRGGGGNGP